MRPGRVRPAPLRHPVQRPGRRYPVAAVAALACPHCGDHLDADGASDATAGAAFRCPRGHTFDVARQGYVALLTARSRTDSADSPEMVAARERFLGAGHYAPIASAVASAVAAVVQPPVGEAGAGAVIAEIGAGTGYYLRAALDAVGPSAAGLALDSSRYAARRAAADSRTISVVADAWATLPMRDGSVAAVTSVFAPRNPAEIARVLAGGATFVAVTPQPAHLSELRDRLTMLTVDDGKAERLVEKFDGLLRPTGHHDVSFTLVLGHADVSALVGMGPSARHVSGAQLADQIQTVPTSLPVTVAVTVSTFVKN